LRIYGGRGRGNLGYVTAYLMCSNPVINNPVRFYVDTGASRTTIADRDTARLDLDYSQLEENQIPVVGIGCKSVKNYLLKRVMLALKVSQDSYHIERLPFVTVLKHEPENDNEKTIIDQLPSLIGIDILKKYSVRFTKKHVVLEK
jgi:hypothetical protein